VVVEEEAILAVTEEILSEEIVLVVALEILVEETVFSGDKGYFDRGGRFGGRGGDLVMEKMEE